MQEIIDKILGGNFDYEDGSLDFSCSKVELTLPKGTIYEGSFHINSTQGCYAKGYVTTSDIRMECLTPEFIGNDVEVSFCFHGENMEEGDVVKGTFSIVSNRGEYYLPFVVSIEHKVLSSSVGTIKNLFHFANLAKSNWQEALKLFYSPNFARVFAGNDAHMYDCYRALSAHQGNEQNMEEFLMQINKKQKVEFRVAEGQIQLELAVAEGPYEVTEAQIDIVRSCWGYTALQVECEGDFLFTEKDMLTDDDFLGNHCRLPVYVDCSLCRRGKNFGTVYIHNSYISLEIPVMVRLGEPYTARRAELKRKRMIVQLMEFYQAFRLKKISTSTWLKETGKLVEQMVAMNENDVVARLFQAQLLITEGRNNEAGWILDHTAELMEREQENDSAKWAYYLYLTTLLDCEDDYVDRVAGEVELIYRKNRYEWRVAWLLLYLSEEYNRNAAVKWQFLEKQFNRGCSSSVIYIEALHLLNTNPTLLRKLDAFEIQVLYFGAKNEVLGSEVTEQLIYLTGKLREYSPVLEKILIKLYDKKSDVRILQEICALLIKGNKVGREYFEWYAKGVEEQLRITNLYEYYMMSVDMRKTQVLPKMVLMYFMYQNNLDYERTAFLYHYVLQNKEKYEDLYADYRPRIERFVAAQMQRGRINRYLAALYQDVMAPGIVTEQTAGMLARLLFAHQVNVEDAAMRKVYVYQPGNLRPTGYQIQDGRAWIVLYGNDNTIVFEDARGNRFMKNVEYTLEKLMVPGKYLRMLAHYVKDSLGLDIYLTEEDRGDGELTAETAERYGRVAASEQVEWTIRRKGYMKLLEYYSAAEDTKLLDAYLEEIPLHKLTEEERAEVIRCMVRQGKRQEVYEILSKYGPYFVDVKILMRFVNDYIQFNGYVEDKVLTAAAVYAFRKGRYNGVLLEYISRYFRGMTKDMRDIWKAAKSFDADCYELCERMLVQMLFSGAFVGEKMEIFRYYVSQGAKQEVEEAIIAQCAYEYFVKEKLTEEYVFHEIYYAYQRGESLMWISKLAFLKYYAENYENAGKEMLSLAEVLLREMMEKRIYLNFFREYKRFAHLYKEMQDKTIIEYRSLHGGRPRINYVMMHETGDADEYVAQYMHEVYSGVYYMDFVLFFGENLQYYIVEECNGDEQLTESGSLQRSDVMNEAPGSKYQMINDMIISKSLQDYGTLDQLLMDYYSREFLNMQLFQLK